MTFAAPVQGFAIQPVESLSRSSFLLGTTLNPSEALDERIDLCSSIEMPERIAFEKPTSITKLQKTFGKQKHRFAGSREEFSRLYTPLVPLPLKYLAFATTIF
jgi:hypothetical protein